MTMRLNTGDDRPPISSGPGSGVWALADEYWEYFRSSAQLWNVDRGDVDQIERWEDLSEGGVAARCERLAEFAARAAMIPAHTSADSTMAAAVGFSAASTAVTLPWTRDLALVGAPANLAFVLSTLVPGYALTSEREADGYLAKLRGIPAFLDGFVDGLRSGVRCGRVATARGVSHLIGWLDDVLASAPADDPLVRIAAPASMTLPSVERWRTELLATLTSVVRPALGELRAILRDEALPHARSDDHVGLCYLPGGAGAYEELLWVATSTGRSSAQIHQLGLDELDRLDAEYTTIGGPLFGNDDPATIRQRLRDDPTLRYSSTADIVADVGTLLGRATTEAPTWFTRLPDADCVALPTNGGPMACYTAPSPDGHRPGRFLFDAAQPARWTRYSLPATVFHETIPGHHLQIGLASELDLHPVLAELEVTAFEEGWGLYAERLADEMGLYTSPLQRIGMLTMDSLRASRLVVDTGLHALAWTRQQAIHFLVEHTALDSVAAAIEIDRYIADPGQATSYMVGRIEIDHLRAEAAAHLGRRFSHRAFHDVVLNGGMTPLEQLARRVRQWATTEP